MSQWNNSYAYNQYQGGNGWGDDVNGQYLNQAQLPARQGPNGQYVSFNEFLTQMQGTNPMANTPNYNPGQYDNYPTQYNYPNTPSTSQNNTYNYGASASTNGVDYPPQTQYSNPNPNPYSNEIILNSNLTPTAMEFVPKSASVKPSSSNQDNLDSSQSNGSVNESKTFNKLDKNWRDKPRTTAGSVEGSYEAELNGGSHDNYKNQETKKEVKGKPENRRKKEEKLRDPTTNSREGNKNPRSKDNSLRNSGTRSKDDNYRNTDNSHNREDNYASLNRDDNARNLVSGRHKDDDYRNSNSSLNREDNYRNSDSSRNREYSYRNSDSSRNRDDYYRNSDSSRTREDNYRNSDSSRNREDNYRNSDGSRNREDNYRNSDGSRNREDNYRNSDSSRNGEDSYRNSDGSRNREDNYRNSDNSRSREDNYRNSDSSRNREDNYRNPESSRNRDSSYRNNESNNWYGESNNRSSDTNSRNYGPGNQESRFDKKKNNPKGKIKDAERTFYNSGISKDSQDVRNGKGEGGRSKNWVGSQRVRPVDRNFVEDEQYANTYLQPREDRPERTPRTKPTSSPAKSKNKQSADQVSSEMTQRERLTEQLDKGTLECLVCCERVKQTDPVWSCGNCYHVLHLRCIRKWAVSSMVEGKWRCPACQNSNSDIPAEYRCMCGAVRSPEYQRAAGGAHTCGRSCRRPRTCPHPCTLLCHPGPCPPCQATVTKQCGCGAETRSVLCSSKLAQVCGRVCGRPLECGEHSCAKDCHEGPCDTCAVVITQVCHCVASKERSVECTRGAGVSWACGAQCGRVAACGAHVCRALCHPPPCPPCPRAPHVLHACPCGKTKIEKDQRKKCTDPIPLCGNICAKPLTCGPDGDKHFCKLNCHEGPCPVCPDKTLLQCRCGHSSREVPCADLPEMYNNVLCQKKCNKKLSCGRHHCRTVCCDSSSHRCAVVCGRTLACQTHRCEEFCHTGRCAPCPRVSFEELRCECGLEVVWPPVRCGTRPPACSAPCRRPRPCGHPPHHSCHPADCPPCVVLTTKRCHGLHEERKTIPCSQEEFSCGMPCGKPLPCGKHTCMKICHKGPCDAGKCTQPCGEKRPSCGHECGAPCHSSGGGPCPSGAACRRPVRATCPCGRRAADRACCDNARDRAKIMSTLAATKMQEGESVDLSDVQRPGSMLKTLECDDECVVEARTRRLALALQIRNPDVSAKLAPRYSDHVRSTAAREPAFAAHVHDRLTHLVHLAKKSKQKTRSHSFPSMNRQKRQFIHEMCEHFGCESVAYDAEPNRNVVATADKEKSWLPAMSVMEVLGREAGQRRVPGPVLRAPASAPGPTAPGGPAAPATTRTAGAWATLTSTNAWAARSQKRATPAPVPEQKIDYFDNPPDN